MQYSPSTRLFKLLHTNTLLHLGLTDQGHLVSSARALEEAGEGLEALDGLVDVEGVHTLLHVRHQLRYLSTGLQGQLISRTGS